MFYMIKMEISRLFSMMHDNKSYRDSK